MGPLIIDANLLVLLVVGSTDRSYIARHKRLGSYSKDDFDLLREFIELGFTDLIVLPHVLAEVSNLASQIHWEARYRIRFALASLINNSTEWYVASTQAAMHEAFTGLGLTDAAVLVACGSSAGGPTILTADRDLATAAQIAGHLVVHFDELRA